MKKIMSIMLAITMLFAACSKEKKLNKKLDGEWNVVSVDGESLSKDGTSLKFKFNKDKKEGTFEMYLNSVDDLGNKVSETGTGTYTLTEDEKINLTLNPNTIFTSDQSIMVVTSYSKTDMTLTLDDGTVMVLEKV